MKKVKIAKMHLVFQVVPSEMLDDMHFSEHAWCLYELKEDVIRHNYKAK
jgi:hypothetical protein